VSDQNKIPDFDPRGPQLVYVAVADHVAARIAAGDLHPGSRLPAERDLAVEYGVAYLTVRRAAQVLRDRGLIVTVHGKGTFVADPLPGESGTDDEGEGTGAAPAPQ
jgi:DNA-binding GntR family transcriptional regulator